jgi:hypothetical protein
MAVIEAAGLDQQKDNAESNQQDWPEHGATAHAAHLEANLCTLSTKRIALSACLIAKVAALGARVISRRRRYRWNWRYGWNSWRIASHG